MGPSPSRRCTTLSLCLLAAALLSSPLFGQAAATFPQSQGAFRKAFRGGSPEERISATKSLAQHAELRGLKLVLRALRGSTARIEAIEEEQRDIAAKRVALQKEINQLRYLLRRKKIGPKKVKRLEAELSALKLDPGRAREERRVVRPRAKAVGWIVRRLNEPRQLRASQLILKSYVQCKNIHDRADFLQAMIWTERSELHEKIGTVSATATEAELRIYALLALLDRGGIRVIAPARAALKDPVFQVRATAIAALHRVGGRDAVDALISVVANEKGRLLSDAIVALKNITGQNFHGNSQLWRNWLDDHGDELDEPEEDKNAQPAPRRRGKHKGPSTGFYGIDPRGKHLVYVIDFSGSMESPLNGSANKRDPGSGPAATLGGKRKVDGAATQLIRSIQSLPSDSTFNVILFASAVKVWKKKMMPATPKNKAAIKRWILSTRTFGATNFFGGLERAFGFTGRGSFDKGYQVTVDTILMLSDGSPTAGRLQKAGEILDAVRELNQLKRVAIHCIGLGRSVNAGFLRRLATENSGEFVHVF